MLAPLLFLEQPAPPVVGTSIPPTFIQTLRTQTNSLIHLLLVFSLLWKAKGII